MFILLLDHIMQEENKKNWKKRVENPIAIEIFIDTFVYWSVIKLKLKTKLYAVWKVYDQFSLKYVWLKVCVTVSLNLCVLSFMDPECLRTLGN